MLGDLNKNVSYSLSGVYALATWILVLASTRHTIADEEACRVVRRSDLGAASPASTVITNVATENVAN